MELIHKMIISKSDNWLIQLFRYTFVGGFAFVVDFGLLYVLTEFAHFHYLTSAAFAFLAGLIVNYILSKLWVFNKSSFKSKTAEFMVFALIGVIGLGLTELLMWTFTDMVGAHYIFSKIFTTILVYFWNFFARKIIIF